MISKVDADFNKSQAADGIVKVFLTSVDTSQTPGDYYAELRAAWTGGNVIKNEEDIILNIEQALVVPVVSEEGSVDAVSMVTGTLGS